MNNTYKQSFATAFGSMVALAAVLFVGSQAMAADDEKATLKGSLEVPAVETEASGKIEVAVADDGTLSGLITTSGITGTMAHIHAGKEGVNGPPIVTLTKEGDTFTVPANTKLTVEQLNAYKSGGLYVNVHSAAHPGGEIRAQLD